MKNDDIASAVAFSPVRTVAALGKPDGSILLWDVDRNQKAPLLEKLGEYEEGIIDLSFAEGGRSMSLLSAYGQVSRWSVAERKRNSDPAAIDVLGGSLVAVSPDGRNIALGQPDGEIILRDAESGNELMRFRDPQGGQISVLNFSHDGKLLASGSTVGDVTVWDRDLAQSNKMLGSFKGDKRAIHCLAFSRDGTLLASGGDYGTVKLWDVKTKKS